MSDSEDNWTTDTGYGSGTAVDPEDGLVSGAGAVALKLR